jgi:hypothetical protein
MITLGKFGAQKNVASQRQIPVKMNCWSRGFGRKSNEFILQGTFDFQQSIK